MTFIKEHRGVLNPSLCEEIVQRYTDKAEYLSKRKNYNLESAIKDLCLSHLNDGYWKDLEKKLKPKVASYLDSYLSRTEGSYSDYQFGSLFMLHCSQMYSVPPHYDSEIDYKDNREELRRFAVLIYLNNSFEGGELIFPVQNKTVVPEPGLLLIFPTSFMYPHFTTPPFGNDRYVLRLSYYLRK